VSPELDDARLLLSGETPVAVHVAALSLRGMAPWAKASTLPAWLRALLLALTAWSVASLGAYTVLRRRVRWRAVAIVLGAAGPLAALGLLRVLERADARPAFYGLLPVAACGLVATAALAPGVLSRLRQRRRAATTPF